MKKRVVIFAPWMPEYRVRFYEKLVELGEDSRIEYVILASSPPNFASGRNDNVSHLSFVKYIKSLSIQLGTRSLEIQNLKHGMIKADLFVLEHSIRSLMMYFILFFRKSKLVFWGHSRTYTKLKSSFEERFKLTIARRAVLYLVYTNEGRDFLLENGLPSDRVHVVNNSTDVERFDLSDSDVKSMRSESYFSSIGLSGPPTCIFLGSLSQDKKLDFLINSAHEIRKSLQDFRLLVLGDGPLRNFVLSEQNDWLRYGGRATDEVLEFCSARSKLILNPGLTGLVAVDSFALGLPLVTTNWKHHAPEFHYLINGKNSVVTNHSVADFSAAVIETLGNPDQLNLLRERCFSDAKNFGVTQMAVNFHSGILTKL
jgi:glycosyltransferase involved in cell wall biosynthesis